MLLHAVLQPRSLTAARLGVGSCLWDGAFVLTAYLATQPPGTFAGRSCGVVIEGLWHALLVFCQEATPNHNTLGLCHAIYPGLESC